MATLFGGRACADPVTTLRACQGASPPLPTGWWGKANLFRNPLGRGPGTGAVLLTGADLDALDLTADHELVFLDDRATDAGRVPLQRITLLRAECLTPGYRGDPRATYLCDVVDRRHFLAQIPTDRAFNVVGPDGTAYLSATLNGGTAWTWAGVVQRLWTDLGLGTAPSLPFTPDGTPESLRYHQASAWEAVNDVLDRVACAVALDPVADAFSFVRLGDSAGAAATALAAELAALDRNGRRLWDGYHREPDRGRLPEKVRVLFPRRPWPTDGTSPYYAVDVTLAATAGVAAGTFVTLRDDLTALGAGTPTNAAALATRAAERAADWRRKRVGFEARRTLVYRDFRAALRPGETAAAAGLDDRGGVMATELDAGPDGALERWRGWEPAVAFGGDAIACAKLAGLRQDECVTFTVPAGYGVDPVTLNGAWSAGAGGWVSAGTVTTSDGPTRLVLFRKAEGGKGLRLVGETQTWYADDLGCVGADREFAAAVTPPALEAAGSASGSSGGCCAGCDDHTFRVRVGCRPAGSAGLPTPAPACVWTRQTDGTWLSHTTSFVPGSSGNWSLRNPADGGKATLSTGAGYPGWYIDCSVLPEKCSGPHTFYAYQAWFDPAACGGLGGFRWNYLYAIGGDIYATDAAATASAPGPADDPWELTVFDGLVIAACGAGPPAETRYACVGGACVPTPGGPYTEATCGGACVPGASGCLACGLIGNTASLAVPSGPYAAGSPYAAAWAAGAGGRPEAAFDLGGGVTATAYCDAGGTAYLGISGGFGGTTTCGPPAVMTFAVQDISAGTCTVTT